MEQKQRKQEGKAWPPVLKDLCHRRRKGRCLCGNGLTTNEHNGKSKIDQRNKENFIGMSGIRSKLENDKRFNKWEQEAKEK